MPDRIYLDHAATTPVRPEVREAMLPFLGEEAFGNPSSAHAPGRAARAAVEHAREQVARAVGAEPGQVTFTSGGTEADNLAVLGVAAARRNDRNSLAGTHLVSSPTEHKAVLAALHEAEAQGARVTLLPVDANGVVNLAALEEALQEHHLPSLVSVMWVNNEVGTVQPVADMAARCAAAGVPFHTDAVQALGKVPVDLGQFPWAAVTVSAHKIGGPKGVGALVVRDPRLLRGIIHGGTQQGGLRPGTENVPGIVGFGLAADLAVAEQPSNARAWGAMRDALQGAINELVGDVVVHGAGAVRAPAILSLSAPGTDSESMLMNLDLAGAAAASGSACLTGGVEPSHVLVAMGVPRDLAAAAVRFSLGPLASPDQVPRVADVYAEVVAKVRNLRRALART
jgi:cysteine desulfurase